ncbi:MULTISPECIES: phage portal protein family protein [Elizabethkingia]|uniref:Head morphogenesis protein n=1 Tax=Elizabethkingia occulta TaxID=1867263 RepID=A0A1T3MA90_9FLAO|nr:MULTISPECIES: DUF935 family protein [Elizabethkingia]MCT4011399.1 DUF935 family protein [Elizabethkingia anophelis]MDE5439382.1 DUF935 domain-containing protein [Elizabethkingia meningoseptica]MDE5516544.1 DUF935 domain-containing protein [Elizabethkingia meningoseptica]MDN4033598.1 DUF935 domain-containing protein [Elizabethkingia meningoseptica]OPC61577.1 head morphogenesis protein [Elizabethkingia occulta]
MEETKIGFETLAAKAKDSNAGKNIKISQVLVVQPPKRDSTDVVKWRSAIKSADKGKRSPLTLLINDLLLDPVMADALDRRIRKITNHDIVFLSDGDEIDEMFDLIDSLKFEELLQELILSKAYGKSVVELAFNPAFDIYSVPRQNLDTKRKVILKDVSQDDGISYENDDFILNIGKDDDLGFLTRVAPYVIFKRNGGADYAQFCELFGIPILAGLYDPEDENARTEMEDSMTKRGAGGSIVMSKNSDIKPISSGEGKSAVHDTFLSWLDEQILIGIIGQTMTTKNGSSLSQSQVHQKTEEEIAESDRRFVQRYLNTYFVPILEKRGYPVKAGFFKFLDKDDTPLKDKLDIALKVDEKTAEGVDDEYFYTTFGLPKGNKTNTKESNPSKEEVPTDQPPKGEKKPKKVDAKGLSLYDKVLNFFGDAPR